MKTIMLMRHSYAVSNNPAYSDRERPLTEAGCRIAHDTAVLMQESGIDRIICSAAIRTVQTADIVAATVNAVIVPLDSLYLARATDYRNAAEDLAGDNDDTILVVGHNPGIASLIMSWSHESLPIVPCTVATFRMPIDDWPEVPNAVPELSDFISDGKRQTLR